MKWLVIKGRAPLTCVTGFAVVLTVGAVPIAAADAQGPAQGQQSYTCQFDDGPRAGQSLTYDGVSGPLIAIGVPCSDGQGSTGSVVAAPPAQAPAPPYLPPISRRQEMTVICRFDRGPRNGQSQSYAGVTGIQPFPEGAPCTDGQGSTGVGIAEPPPMPAQPPSSPVQLPPSLATSFNCHFDSGPRAGQTQSYAGVTGMEPLPLGARCTDGQGSSGTAVPDAADPTGAPAESALPRDAEPVSQPAVPPEPLPAPPPPEPPIVPGVPSSTARHADEVPGAAIGASVRGLSGAKWADPKNSGSVTGYTYSGRYHRGAPPGYDPTTATVLSQSVGAVAVPGPGIPQNAIVGSAVRGEPGAVWADLNNDGVADGYVEHGRYFPGVPPGFAVQTNSTPDRPSELYSPPPVMRSGERGMH